MKEKDFARIYGFGAAAMTTMSKLAHQIKTQGGEEEDIRLLDNDEIMARVAKVLAAAGRLDRSFSIRVSDDFNWIEVLLPCYSRTEFDPQTAVSSWSGRLITKAELAELWRQNPDLLRYEDDDLFIIGERLESIDATRDKYCALTKSGLTELYLPKNQPLNEVHCRLAMVFN